MKGPFHFIVNPAAGGGRARRIWPEIEERLKKEGVSYQWTLTRGPGDAGRIAAGLSDDVIAVAVGGDGTLSEMISGIDPQSVEAIGLEPVECVLKKE